MSLDFLVAFFFLVLRGISVSSYGTGLDNLPLETIDQVQTL